jgi:hypothetical protein
MKKNKQGIYLLPDYLEKKPKGQGSRSGRGAFEMHVSGELPRGDMPSGGRTARETPEVANRDGCAVIRNGVCPKWAAGKLINWTGDQGWLQRIGWDSMSILPGYPESVIPLVTKDVMPALFGRCPYLEKVPFMRGIRPAWPALEGDTIICNACVTDKYSKNGEYFVDLIFWCQTLDRYPVVKVHATVKLPKRQPGHIRFERKRFFRNSHV